MSHPDTHLAIPDTEVSYRRRVGFPADLDTFRKTVMMCSINLTEKGLVLSILDDLKNPDLRDIYADWLETQGRVVEAQAERNAATILRQPSPQEPPFLSGSLPSGRQATWSVPSNLYGNLYVSSGYASVRNP